MTSCWCPWPGRRATGKDRGLSQPQRIGVGLALSALVMAYSALLERKRRLAAGAVSIKDFFSRSRFLTGGHRNKRLPRNLGNTAYLPNEFFQTNFEFNFFHNKTNKVCTQIVTCFWHGGVVKFSRTNLTDRGIELWPCTEANFPSFFNETRLKTI
jgi:hypothetical protein